MLVTTKKSIYLRDEKRKKIRNEKNSIVSSISIIINQVTIKLSTYGTIAGSDRSANNKCEGLFSGLRDIWLPVSVSFPLNDYKIQCLHGAGVPGPVDTSRVDLTTKQK